MPKDERDRLIKIIGLGALALLAIVVLTPRIGLIPAAAAVALTARVASVLLNRFRLQRARRDWSSSTKWPSTTGTVGHVSVARRNYQRGRPTAFQGTLTYSYSVAGIPYSGVSSRAFGSYDEAWNFVDGCRDKMILVAYHPAKPEMSVFAGVDGDPVVPSPKAEPWLPPELFEVHLRSLSRAR